MVYCTIIHCPIYTIVSTVQQKHHHWIRTLLQSTHSQLGVEDGEGIAHDVLVGLLREEVAHGFSGLVLGEREGSSVCE